MDNRPLATSNYKEALKLDVYCFEAFDLLTSHHMLTAQEGEAGEKFTDLTVIGTEWIISHSKSLVCDS